jgi:nucleoside 2-deoxyribosyltransferase
MHRLKIYLAGGISLLSYKEATEWRDIVAAKLSLDRFDILDPMRQKSYLSSEEAIKDSYPNTITAGSKAVYRRDKFDVARCDVVLVNLDTVKQSVGTFVEIGMADALNKLIIIVSSKKITHPFLTENSILISNLDDAIEFIKGLVE